MRFDVISYSKAGDARNVFFDRESEGGIVSD